MTTGAKQAIREAWDKSNAKRTTITSGRCYHVVTHCGKEVAWCLNCVDAQLIRDAYIERGTK